MHGSDIPLPYPLVNQDVFMSVAYCEQAVDQIWQTSCIVRYIYLNLKLEKNLNLKANVLYINILKDCFSFGVAWINCPNIVQCKTSVNFTLKRSMLLYAILSSEIKRSREIKGHWRTSWTVNGIAPRTFYYKNCHI